jgi:pimeloyl-ACP methyl ester carboxylesterase
MPNSNNNNTVHYFDYGVDQLAYFDAGNGPVTILLLHGFGEDHCIWKRQIDFLSQYYRIIAPNLPGVYCKPLTLHHTASPSIKNYVQIMHELMHHLHIDQYYIMGHSMGAYIGLAMADYYVNHVKGIGLIHSTSFADSDAKKISRLKVAEFLQEKGTLAYLELATQNLFGQAFKKAHPDQIQQLIENASEISKEAMIQFVMAMRNRTDYTYLLSQQNIPIWMIVGKQDIAIPFEDAQVQMNLLPSNHVLVLEEVGHMGMLEATDAVNNALYQFIQSAENK